MKTLSLILPMLCQAVTDTDYASFMSTHCPSQSLETCEFSTELLQQMGGSPDDVRDALATVR